MDEKLYYEAEVKYGDDVRKVYDVAIEKNVKFYRGISASGKYFGWLNDKFVSAEDGQEWFINSKYKEPEVTDEQPLEAVETITETKKEQTEEQTITKETAIDDAETPSNKQTFDFVERITELEKALVEKSARLVEDEEKLAKLKNAVKVIIDFIREV